MSVLFTSPTKIAGMLALLSLLIGAGCSRSGSVGGNLNARVEKRFWPVRQPDDNTLSQNHPLSPFMRAAADREFPLTPFRDLIRSAARIEIMESDIYQYIPSNSGGTIYTPAITNLSQWSRSEWASFYGLLFRAWFENVAPADSRYRKIYQAFHSPERATHYQRANQRLPWLAQEDAFADTISCILYVMSPLNSGSRLTYPEITDLDFEIDRTVAPVSRSGNPGYSPEADTTYPSESEYRALFFLLTSVALT
jgi:hypothetical protein